MSNRWIRFLLAVLAIAAAAAAAYRVVQNEQQLARHAAAAREADVSAHLALSAVEELKAALHAYVAPGQGSDFWTARAEFLLNVLRSSLLALDAPAAGAGAPIAEALDASDRLAAAERRAAGYVRDEQPLLAAEVIFTDARDLLDGLRIQVARARDRIATSEGERQLALRREQIYLLAGGAGVLALVMLLLVPTGRATPAPEGVSNDFATDTATSGVPARVSGTDLDTTGDALVSICSDIARVTDSSQLEPLLNRTRALLEARGVIVWLSSADGSVLQPAVVSGYDARVLARIGSIAPSDSNLTADAYRENATRTSDGSRNAPAAIAVPLPAPAAAAGVFSAELTKGAGLDAARVNAARLIAAQLGSVLGTAKSPDGASDAASAAAARSSS